MEFNMLDLISVIVPIYNVEMYLERCIQSIQNQTYTNLEIILVDDGSPDKCGEICDRYAALDDRIKVIHKANGGLADARNCGIDIATGEYIAFVDSDDFIHPQMYEKLAEVIKLQQADVVISSWKKVRQNEQICFEKISGTTDIKLLDRDDIQSSYFEQPDSRITYTVAWNKLYRRTCFEEQRFPKGKLHEDEFVTFKILYNADKVAYIPDELYFYLVRDVSIMGKFSVKRFDIFDAYIEKLDFYICKGEYELAGKMFLMSIHMLMQYSEWIEKNDSEGKKVLKHYYNRWKDIYRQINNIVIFNKMQRIDIFLFRINKYIYKFIWKFMRASN